MTPIFRRQPGDPALARAGRLGKNTPKGGVHMTRALIKVAGSSLLLALGGCMHAQMHAPSQSEPAAAEVAAATPSPRAECAPAQVTLYFGEQVASDEPVVTPLLNQLMERIHACEAAGGELRVLTIVASADPGQRARAARDQVRRRQARVRAVLVDMGAPADKIVYSAAPPSTEIMGRRAEITADLY
jgi:hypothetical protein